MSSGHKGKLQRVHLHFFRGHKVNSNNWSINSAFFSQDVSIRAVYEHVPGLISCGQYLRKKEQRAPSGRTLTLLALGLPLDRGDWLGKYLQWTGLCLGELNKHRLGKQAPTCLITWLNKQWSAADKRTHTHTHTLTHRKDGTQVVELVYVFHQA